MIGQIPLQMVVPHTDAVSQTQQNVNQRGAMESAQAMQTVQKQVEQAHDTVIPKDTLELHDYRYDAKEEGNNKYEDRRKKKKKASAGDSALHEEETETVQPRVNFDIKI